MKHYAYYINCATEEIHKSGCPNIPTTNKINLGKHTNASKALKVALSKGFTNANGCPHCCLIAHKK